ncbi:Flp pilus assembly protein CpaB [Agromyces humi]|uniref:Flp pilus assembly protein CpaB n=1 Tax=Agromyces humi TaxID=1766800 RepID=UPI00135B3B12|nr:pilus assembly protein [Agromyces humi]
MKTRIIGAIVALMLAGLGAFVLIAYVRGADARAADGATTTDVYIVAEEIPEGTSGDGIADFVKVDSLPQRNVAPGAVTDLADLAGLVSDATILPGEQLLEARFIDPLELAARGDVPVPAGMQLVSFTLPADRVVGGAIVAGDRIGMVGTVPERKDANGQVVVPAYTSQFAFNGVLVTRVQGVSLRDSEADPEATEQDPTAAIMLTIALSTHDVERWVWFSEGEDGQHHYADMWLTLQNDATDTGGSSPVDLGNAFQ